MEMGAVLKREFIVTPEMLAASVGSGDVRVLATPVMIANMEGCAAALAAQELEEGETTVGTHMNVSHDAATPQGMRVRVECTLTVRQGRKLEFAVRAFDECGPIGAGTHTRVVVNRERFTAKANSKQPPIL